MQVSDANLIFKGEVLFNAEFVDRPDENEQRTERFGEMVRFKAVELTEHIGIVLRPFFEESRYFLGMFTNRSGKGDDRLFDRFVGAFKEFFPRKICWLVLSHVLRKHRG